MCCTFRKPYTSVVCVTGAKKKRRRKNDERESELILSYELKKTADILRRHHWFPHEMTSEKRAQKFHTDGASLPRSGWCFRLVVLRGIFVSTNQTLYPNLGSDASSVWNFDLRSFFRHHFRGETSGDVTKCRLFPQANLILSYLLFYIFR